MPLPPTTSQNWFWITSTLAWVCLYVPDIQGFTFFNLQVILLAECLRPSFPRNPNLKDAEWSPSTTKETSSSFDTIGSPPHLLQQPTLTFQQHRYVFVNDKKARLQEIGPRFTLKLKSLQKGTFSAHHGEFVWVYKKEHETSRRRFFL